MSREIKFRAWDKVNKIMTYNSINAINFDGQILLNDGKFHDINKTDYILMQDTGFVDKNGIKIFEGDVVHISGIGNYEITDIRQDFDILVNAIVEGDLNEIVGNIYENPELITEVKNG